MMRRKARRAVAGPVRRGAVRRGAFARRGVLAAVLLAIIIAPLPSLASSQPAPSCRGCHVQSAGAERWTARLSGQWAAGDGATGTVPVSGQAYVAAGRDLAVVGDGLTLSAYRLRDGALAWQRQLAAGAGWTIMSVRAWPGVITVGITGPSGTTRTEIVIDAATGAQLRRYPAAVFGGAVAASARTTVVVGAGAVTSYDNQTGKVRWQRRTAAGQAWRTDGTTLYMTESKDLLGAAPVTGLQVIDLSSGAERSLDSPAGSPFAGTLAGAVNGVVLFTSASGVSAYSGSTGGQLWSRANTVPEGTDPVAGRVYLTSDSGSLIGVDAATGKVLSSVPGSATTGAAGIYVVRGGVALGLDTGANGDAWGYSVAAGRVTWTTAGLPWPHYFTDLSGVGGSASLAGDIVVVAACAHLAATRVPAGPASPSVSPSVSPSAATPSATGSQTVTSSPPGSPSPSSTPSPAPSAAPVQLCADPELVALNV